MVRPRTPLLQPKREDAGAEGDGDRAEDKENTQRRAADRLLRDMENDNAGENRQEDKEKSPHDPPHQAGKADGGVDLVKPHVLQRKGAHRQCQRDHPVAIVELNVRDVRIESRNISHHVGAQSVGDPDGKANDEGVDQLEKLLPGPNGAVKAATAVRVAVSHYIVRSDDDDQFLAQLRHAVGIKTS